jgi:2-polyprenyl-3-methyl-5-hydroxy-6-metoxy-1,4-benzoquinol methylase
MKCPLCDSSRSVIVRKTVSSELKRRWLASFDFDPFPSDFVAKHIDKKRCASCHLEFFDPPIYGDASFYEKISKHPWYYEENKWEYDVAAEKVAQIMPENLLEIGCGNGHFLEKIVSLGIDVEGVDINRDAVESCKTKGLKVEAVNVFEIDKQYDMVVLFEVLEHMENAKELFEFISTKVLRRGGHLVVAVPNPEGYLKEMDINLLDMPPHHNSSWSLSCFESLRSLHGLTMVDYQKEPIRLVHYNGFVQHLVRSNAGLAYRSLKIRIFCMVQSLIIRTLAPLTYLKDRLHIDGQTHLVVFQSVR